MARGCSGSDSEEERHDRFKSERNPSSAPTFRRNLPGSLDSYSSRARSPPRQNSHKVSRHRSRYSEERRYSPHRRAKSPERRESRDKRSPKENKDSSRSSSSDRKHSKHRHRKSQDISRSERYEEDSRKRVVDDAKHSDHKRTEVNDRLSDKIRSVEKDSRVSNYDHHDLENREDSNEKKLKKHKRSHERSQNHDGKKRKKDKKHKRKHDKKKNENESPIETLNENINNEPMVVEDSIDLTKDLKHSGDEFSNSDDSDNEVSQEKLSAGSEDTSPEREGGTVGEESEHEEGELSGSESEQFGPALPPGKTKAEMSYGPAMPAEGDLDQYGPALPPPAAPPAREQESPAEDDETGDVIGPLPLGHASAAQSALDARASILKLHMDNKPEEDGGEKREAWMLELPEVRGAQLGLGPRKFRANPAPDMSDRSSWTDTPEEKARKKLEGGREDSCELDTRKLEILERNKEMEQLAKKSEKKSKSLLDIHQKELKKKKKKEEKLRGGVPEERIPFSRENDLQTHKFDEAQKRSIIKKAQFLDSRFSIGESKFL